MTTISPLLYYHDNHTPLLHYHDNHTHLLYYHYNHTPTPILPWQLYPHSSITMTTISPLLYYHDNHTPLLYYHDNHTPTPLLPWQPHPHSYITMTTVPPTPILPWQPRPVGRPYSIARVTWRPEWNFSTKGTDPVSQRWTVYAVEPWVWGVSTMVRFVPVPWTGSFC